ncbi:MAG: T9SS type A sorting domain-containing protein [Janthinobacterium lividum]
MKKPLNTLHFPTSAFYRSLSYRTILLASILLFLGGLVPAWAGAGFTSDIVYISGTNQAGSANGTYFTNSPGASGASAAFNGVNLGTFDRNADKSNSLFINAEANTSATDGDLVQSTQLYYRVYRVDGAGEQGNPLPLNLAFNSGKQEEMAKWINLSNQLDLLSLAATASPGDYYLEVYFSGQGVLANSTDNFTFVDDNGTQRYKAKFSVTVNGNQFRTSTWTSTSNQDWFTFGNWSTGTPDSNTDVIISEDAAVFPQISDNGYGNQRALARNITLIGTDGQFGDRILEQEANTRLLVSGNFQDLNSGFLQNGGVLELNGQNQTFDASPTLNNLTISGGGTKTFSGGLSVANSLVFNGIGAGILATNNSNPSLGVTLQPTATLTEYEGAYILGLVKTTRIVGQSSSGGAYETFGGIGLDLRANSQAAGTVTVVRTSYIYSGAGKSVSIQRGFSVTANATTLTNFDLVFHYLYNNLNNIAPSNLRLFRSATGRIPFEGLGFTSADVTGKTLTRTGLSGRLASIFTLGDVTNPLPVELVSFAATGTTQGAALKWLTASEVNNKGFGVERQVVGATTWQSVGYVNATNLANGSSYSFLDKTIPASATQVYYRLRQEDIDGSLHYSPVATISRAAQGADLTLSPVPLQGGPLAVSFAEASQAGTEILVLNMQGQRVARYTTAASTDEAVSLPLDNLATGVYLVSVQVPGQATRHARFVKQ